MRESDSNNLVIQFRQNKTPVGTPTTGNTGNAKKDMIRIVYSGLADVPVTDMTKCFEKVQIGIMADEKAKNLDWTKCVATLRTLS